MPQTHRNQIVCKAAVSTCTCRCTQERRAQDDKRSQLKESHATATTHRLNGTHWTSGPKKVSLVRWKAQAAQPRPRVM